MAPPVETALDMIEARKHSYRDNAIPYYRPIIMLITDGRPEHDDPKRLEHVAQRVRQAETDKHLTFFGVGTDSADMATLARFSSLPPKTLRDTDFVALFEWLSNSITAISNSQPGQRTNLPSTDSWSHF